MKILLLSDTHSYIDNQILKHAKNADEVWHAGDIGSLDVTDQIQNVSRLRAVFGNIDSHEIRKEFPLHQQFIVEGLSVWMTHIGGYPGRYAKEVREKMMHQKPDLFISGHSHILKVMRDKTYKLLHMNPGAIGIHGFHSKRTMLQFEVNQSKIENLVVIDLGKRGELK
ncbi:MAG: metallophosphatase family protein [Flavobacteriaceae bacterium]|nr:metallophosphatase family protein [Flavobacteriaceae bacterium]